jgi:hypothetical protein
MQTPITRHQWRRIRNFRQGQANFRPARPACCPPALIEIFPFVSKRQVHAGQRPYIYTVRLGYAMKEIKSFHFFLLHLHLAKDQNCVHLPRAVQCGHMSRPGFPLLPCCDAMHGCEACRRLCAPLARLAVGW